MRNQLGEEAVLRRHKLVCLAKQWVERLVGAPLDEAVAGDSPGGHIGQSQRYCRLLHGLVEQVVEEHHLGGFLREAEGLVEKHGQRKFRDVLTDEALEELLAHMQVDLDFFALRQTHARLGNVSELQLLLECFKRITV